jgi:hypothetical protein
MCRDLQTLRHRQDNNNDDNDTFASGGTELISIIIVVIIIIIGLLSSRAAVSVTMWLVCDGSQQQSRRCKELGARKTKTRKVPRILVSYNNPPLTTPLVATYFFPAGFSSVLSINSF